MNQMRGDSAACRRAVVAAAWTILTASTVAFAQAPVARSPAAATPALPRAADGKPDFSGVWQVLNTAAWDIEAHNADTGTPPGEGVVEGGAIPYQPWALEKKNTNFAKRLTDDTDVKCFMPGVPRITYMPYPFR